MKLNLKKIIGIGLLTIILINIIACSKDGEVLENEFVIAFDETKSIASEDMTIKFSKIDESRCPDEVNCLWEGVADVTFEITHMSETTVSTLGTLRCDSKSAESGFGQCVEKEIFGYLFTLTSVEPYPNVNLLVDDTDYSVKLIISKI